MSSPCAGTHFLLREEQVVKGFPLYLIWAVAIVGQVASFALLISGLLKLVSLLIPRARLRVGRIAKVTALVSLSVLAPLLFSVFLFILVSLFAAIPSDVIQSTAVAALTLAMTVTITWLFFRLLPTQDTPERPSYSTWTTFRERFIDLASMEPPLRLLTALAIAQLLASAILLVVSQLWPHERPLAVATYHGQSVHLDPRVFKATLGYLLIAWPLVLVGASPGRLTFPLILVLFTLTTLPWKELSHHVPVLISLATIATVWSWALFTWRKHTRSSELPSTPRLRRLILNLLFLGSVLGIHYSFLKAFLPPAGLGSLPSLVTEQIFNLSLLLVPILFLTGKDCAELSELGAHFTLAVVGRTLSRPLLPIVALLVGGGILYWSIQTFHVPLSAYAEFLNYFTPLTVAVVSALSFFVFSILTHLLYRFAQRQPLLLRIPLFSVATIIGFVALVSAIFMLLASFTYGVVIVALGLAAVLALRALAKASALHQSRSAHVPFVAILLTAVFLTGAHELVTLWQARAPQLPHHPTELTFAVAQCSGHSAQLSATASPECSFSYPQDWQWCFLPDSRTFEFREVASGQSPCDESQSTRPLFLLGVRNLSELEPFSSPSSTAEDLARASGHSFPRTITPATGTAKLPSASAPPGPQRNSRPTGVQDACTSGFGLAAPIA